MSNQKQDDIFLCRELALLEFNKRVLAQATDKEVPLLERLKFLCIVSSNLDEFFEVRVASLKRLAKISPNTPLINGENPIQVLKNVRAEARNIIHSQYQILSDTIFPLLRSEGIKFLKRQELNELQKEWIENFFIKQIKPILTPIGLDPAHPFPKLLNKSLNFIIELEGKDTFGRPSKLAILQAPRILPRIVELPYEISGGQKSFVFLSSIIHEQIQSIFLGMNVKGFYQFRLTRDSELTVDDDDLTNLLTAIQGELHERQYGKAVRLEVATNCPKYLYQYLMNLFGLEDDELYLVNGPVNLNRLISIPDLINRPDLKFPIRLPVLSQDITESISIFDQLKKKDILLHHPYQSFQHVVNFISQSALDPHVVAIKMTIYRAGSQSDIINALILAAKLGKEVTVVVELMARFDEAANVNWASKLEDAGAHVVYGVVGYKVHAKMTLIIRKEEQELKRYGHLGTGNYHQGTSKLYTDFGLLTADREITEDMNDIFIQITGLGKAGKLKKIFQSPFTLHSMLIESIKFEIEQAKIGKPAKIMAKMNSLVEPELIHFLYEASEAGVEIHLIVRGICALSPGVKGLSDNIKVYSIVGRLLEHSRVFYFFHEGKNNLYISSADWMGRNMFQRIETCIPIIEEPLKARVINESFTLALKNNTKAWIMNSDGSYDRKKVSDDQVRLNLQENIFNLYN